MMQIPASLSLLNNNSELLNDRHSLHADDSSIATLRHALSFDNGVFSARYGEARLHSAYQPIVGLCHERTIGYEGLLRPVTAQGVAGVEQLFSQHRSLAELIRLDRLARLLHTINFSLVPAEPSWLFLNVHPEVFVHGYRFGAFFDEMLAISGQSPHSLVIEVLESAISNEEQIAGGVHYYRQRGCLIALDDFGADSSNLDRVVRLQPDIVKLDRSLIGRAAVDASARRLLNRLVALLHEGGIMVVIEGIETEEEGMIALDSDADFGQGYLFAKPAPLPQAAPLTVDFTALNQRLQQERAAQQQQSQPLQYLAALFETAARHYASGKTLQEAAVALLTYPEVQRLYLLDGQGHERSSIVAPHSAALHTRQNAPLHDTLRANWSRRPYFRAAQAQPGSVQLTTPYPAIFGQQLCRTFSVAVATAQGSEVLCCDIDSRGE